MARRGTVEGIGDQMMGKMVVLLYTIECLWYELWSACYKNLDGFTRTCSVRWNSKHISGGRERLNDVYEYLPSNFQEHTSNFSWKRHK